jgi:chemosensory pili system protein ChpA (sensor histidine kinase/response regulator)
MEIQAESQMQSRLSQNREGDQFDPLEFDRFTRLQELTRFMAESVGDVATVQKNLARSLDETVRELTAQQRLTRELQQDLMRVRMLRFGSIAERLHRVVRQSARELGKEVHLDIHGEGAEIDRGVLERMAAPFEHLLRNAVVHGIEDRDARVAAGKPEAGQLLVAVRPEGNEMVIELRDDGGGLQLERLRARALEMGLPVADLNDGQTAQLIFQPGLSTAGVITELAGRGIGMDVVRDEVSSLGGRIEVDSVAGRGTAFLLHLPLTMAVAQVVLVEAGGRTHALPALLVEQVLHVRAQALVQAAQEGFYPHAGRQVRFYPLLHLLGEAGTPLVQRLSTVLILRAGTRWLALHVDQVSGSQEVVVKDVGPQLARLPGIAGATVTGTGGVVLILNPFEIEDRFGSAIAALTGAVPVSAGLPSDGLATGGSEQGRWSGAGEHVSRAPTVMVVDDSLTVRRITQRLLLREAYQVMLAKDGVDALEQLQGEAPDLMLVDIEMPRMDGFDLTRNLRSDLRYRTMPIIMITSRTADKHRNYAIELGVDCYLGKPYDEAQLLAAIRELIAARSAAGAEAPA